MRILILGTAHPYRGGLASYIERLATQFMAEGHETEIFTFSLQYPGFLFPGKTQYTDAPPPPGLKIRRVLNSVNPFNWIRTGRLIRKKEPDILIIKYWHPFMAPAFSTVARSAVKNGITRVICIFDNVIPHEKSIIDRFLSGLFVRTINGAIVMSTSVMYDLKTFKTNFPVRFNPHPLFDNYGSPVPREEALGKLGLPADHSYLLFFGFIRAYKGLDILLEAFGDVRLRGKKVKLIIAGEFYEDDRPYRDMINKYSIADEIILYDRFIREDEVASFFCAADVVVQPYRSATQSGVTQIAYHYEKPMLVTDVGGLSEIVSDGVSGYVVEPDPGSVADALADFFDKDRYTQFTEGVIKEKDKFSWDKLTGKVMEIYEESKKYITE